MEKPFETFLRGSIFFKKIIVILGVIIGGILVSNSSVNAQFNQQEAQSKVVVIQEDFSIATLGNDYSGKSVHKFFNRMNIELPLFAAINNAPVAVNDSYSVSEDTTLTVTLAEGVLKNDTDVDGVALSAILVSGPTNGMLTLNANGSFSYTPNANYNGTDSFTYKANDGTADSNVVTVTITVFPVNDAPVAVDDSRIVSGVDTLTVKSAEGVLMNDTDIDGDPLTAILVTDPVNGKLVLNVDGSFSYTPNANYNGMDSFTYKANDGTADSNVATVTITVESNPAELTSSAAQLTYGTDVTFTFSIPAINAIPFSGKVKFSDENTPLCEVSINKDGTAQCTVKWLSAGSHTITASYAGDSNYKSYTKSLEQIVNKATSEISLNVLKASVGETTIEVEVNAIGDAIPTGSVVINVDGKSYTLSLVVNGSARLILTELSTGEHKITATYHGDNNIDSSKSLEKVFNVLSNNANLSGMSISNVNLSPVFSTSVTTYSANVANQVSNIAVIPSSSDSNAKVTVNGKPVSTGEASEIIPLNVGNNNITIVVTAQDGVTTNTYTLMVARAASSDATLNRLTVSEGTLSPAFDSHTEAYTVNVDPSVTSVDFEVSPTDSHAGVQINGNNTKADTVTLKIGQATSIPIVVTAQDGGTKTYTVTVTKIPVSTGIVLTPKTGQVTVGDTQKFDLVENLSDETTKNQTANAIFTVSDSKVASIQGNILTAIAPGTVTVTAKYGSSSETATITVVNRVVPPVPQPTPQPVVPVPEPTPSSPSNQILIQRVLENGVVSYRANVTLGNVQAIIQQLTNGDERVVRVQFPAEAADGEAIVKVQREAVAFLAQREVDLMIELANGTLRIPHESLNDFTEELYFRIVPVPSDTQEPIEENAQQNEQVQTFVGNQMTVNLFGQPVTIETNLQNRPVTITLPIPDDATEEQLKSLFVYIEHSDGTTEVKQGRIVEIAPGVQAFAFDVTHFSTFSLFYTTEVEEVKTLAPYIKGYPDGTFKPNTAVTRAQMATMLARFLTNGNIPVAPATFEDTKNNGSKDAIEFVKQLGLFNGTTATTFNPNGTITRAQMAGVVARWIERKCAEGKANDYCQETGKGKAFTDVAASHWAAASIEKVNALGIMSGNSATTFNPNGALTRAQAVKVLNQIFGRPALEGIEKSSFTDVPPTHWAIGDIEAAAIEMKKK